MNFEFHQGNFNDSWNCNFVLCSPLDNFKTYKNPTKTIYIALPVVDLEFWRWRFDICRGNVNFGLCWWRINITEFKILQENEIILNYKQGWDWISLIYNTLSFTTDKIFVYVRPKIKFYLFAIADLPTLFPPTQPLFFCFSRTLFCCCCFNDTLSDTPKLCKLTRKTQHHNLK